MFLVAARVPAQRDQQRRQEAPRIPQEGAESRHRITSLGVNTLALFLLT